MSVLADRLMQVLAAVLPGDGPKALHEPEFAGNEWAYTKECIDSGWVSSAGKFVEEFEARLAEFTGARSAVAVVNGTAALHICLLLAGAGPGDEVLAPALTFVATANAVSYCGAVPHFVDSDPKTLGIDPCRLGDYLRAIAERARRPPRESADRPPHPRSAADARLRPSRRHGAAAGPWRRVRPLGDRGRRRGARQPLQGTADRKLGPSRCIQLQRQQDRHDRRRRRHHHRRCRAGAGGEASHDDRQAAACLGFRPRQVGYNYRMPNLNAALGCAQLEQLAGFPRGKARLAERYRRALAEPAWSVLRRRAVAVARSNYWLNGRAGRGP